MSSLTGITICITRSVFLVLIFQSKRQIRDGTIQLITVFCQHEFVSDLFNEDIFPARHTQNNPAIKRLELFG